MTLTRLLLASTAISLSSLGFAHAGPVSPPLRPLSDPGYVSAQSVLRIQMSVEDAEAALAAAQARLEEAQASGGDVAAAQAAVDAARANLDIAQTAPAPATVPVPEAAPAPEPAPENIPVPEPAPEPDPAPEPEAAPAAEEPAPVAEPAPEAVPIPEPAPEAPAEQPTAEDVVPEAVPAPVTEPATEEPAIEEPAPDAEEAPEAQPAPEPIQEAPDEQPAAEPAPAPEAQPDPAAEAPAVEPAPEPAQEAPDEQPAAEAPAPEAVPAPEEAAPAADPAAEPAPAPDQASEVPASDAAPEQATQPAAEAPAAVEADVLVLPVEDGAPVLDSAKEEPVAGEVPAPAAPASSQPAAPPPTSDAQSQSAAPRIEPAPQALLESGERFDQAPVREQQTNVTIINQVDNRTLIEIDNRTIIEHDDRERLQAGSEEVYYERLSGERIREVVVRPNGVQLVTITNRWGDMIQRSRIMPDGREYVLFYADASSDGSRHAFVDPGRNLPRLQLQIPIDEYILDATAAEPSDYLEFLMEPPVEQVERLYSVEEVRRSARIRDKVRRIDLDSLTFEFGKASIAEDQIPQLSDVAAAMTGILEENPAETFLIEGHTDAVGTDNANLLLSDKRSETIAVALSDVFGIPPENLVTQGYGERYLKVRTEAPERLNRRVTIRRITPLVTPVASR